MKTKKQIDKLLSQILKQSKTQGPSRWKITPPLAEKNTNYQQSLLALAKLRGRENLYPYIGSGQGKGVYVELLDSSIKMDLLSGIGVQILGHSHTKLQKSALRASLSNIVMQGHLLLNSEYLQLSHKLVELAQKKSRLKYVWLSGSGSMANENALKMARQKNRGRRKILTFEHAFAGRTTLMSEITANPKIKEGLPPYNEVLRIPFYDPKQPNKSLKALKLILKKQAQNIGVFVFEIVLGEGGYKSAPKSFFTALIKECKKHGIFIWADEVQTFLRTGEAFAFEKWGLGHYMDLVTVGKGLQLAGTFFTEELKPKPGLISSTFSATGQALSAGLTLLNILQQQGYMGKHGKIALIEKEFKSLFQELKDKGLIKNYNVFGLMAAFSLLDPTIKNTKTFLQKLFSEGVIALLCGQEGFARVRFLPPAVIKSQDIKVLRKTLFYCLKSFYSQNKKLNKR